MKSNYLNLNETDKTQKAEPVSIGFALAWVLFLVTLILWLGW